MNKYLAEFLKRGLMAMGGGPIVLATVYLILWKCGVLVSLGADEVVLGILTVSLMAFIAGGINVIYSIERLPLIFAILIHGGVLYLDYGIIYVLNGWIADGAKPFLIFTAVFVAGYALVWAVIYAVTRANTEKLNRKLSDRR